MSPCSYPTNLFISEKVANSAVRPAIFYSEEWNFPVGEACILATESDFLAVEEKFPDEATSFASLESNSVALEWTFASLATKFLALEWKQNITQNQVFYRKIPEILSSYCYRDGGARGCLQLFIY